MGISIGLIGLGTQKLLRPNGENLIAVRLREPKGSLQILAGNMLDLGYDVRIIDLKKDHDESEVGSISWCGEKLTKVIVGTNLANLQTQGIDIVGITVQCHQQQEVALMVISEMKRRGHKVIVGGSEAYADPATYLAAGADVVVLDKSGASNNAAIETALGLSQTNDCHLATTKGEIRKGYPQLSPEYWPIPPHDIIQQTLGTEYWEGSIPQELKPIGAVMLDIGCNRNCDFCQTPTYKLHIQKMSPQRALMWLSAQKSAGARSVVILSDQFLGRQLFPGGREEILEIMEGIRRLGLAMLYGNGLELAKATKGNGLPGGDASPDTELVNALWGWDPVRQIGCAQTYIAAERPVEGPLAYPKLLKWPDHLTMIQAVVEAGVPDITYGVIVGFDYDSNDTLERLYEHLAILRTKVKKRNPSIRLRICPFALLPIPGTPQGKKIRQSGLMEYDDPWIVGGFWTPCARTNYLSIKEISHWQKKITNELNDPEPNWQGVSALS